ncbi:MAG TPA: hypothetical protein VFU51_07510 [Gaiellaceae bacterium]|jgi:hypothetical protein|nr:hypothetical protein [Gaiellaceae bacterium]
MRRCFLYRIDAPVTQTRTSRTTRVSRLLRGGVEGNERLTGTSALLLLVLLAAEGATIPFVRQQLTLHIFLGLLLIPPVLLKLGSTGWRFARYYLRDAAYVRRGPPHAFLRLVVAPLTVASTAALFATGVALVIVQPQQGLIVGLHKASFVVWFGAMGVHVLTHVLKVPRLARADYVGASEGVWLRQFAIAAALVAGVIVAIAALPAAHDWAHWAALHHHEDH